MNLHYTESHLTKHAHNTAAEPVQTAEFSTLTQIKLTSKHGLSRYKT